MNPVYQGCILPFPNWQKFILRTKEENKANLTTFMNSIPPNAFGKIFKAHKKIANSAYDFDSIKDNKRMQFTLDDKDSIKYFGAIKSDLNKLVACIQPSLHCTNFSILRSLANGVKQIEHSDFTNFDFPKFAGILSIDDNTKLGIQNVENEFEIVHIKRGEVLIFITPPIQLWK